MVQLKLLGIGCGKEVYINPANPDEVLLAARPGKERVLREEIEKLQALARSALNFSHLAFEYRDLAEADVPDPLLRGRYVVAVPRAGSDLEKAIRNPFYDLPARVSMCLQAIQGISELHRANWVHGDVKLDNYLVYHGGEGEVQLKLADFGLAQPLDAKTIRAHFKGNTRFKEPEGVLSHQGEVFSLALVCVRILEELLLSDSNLMLVEPDRSLFSSFQWIEKERGVIQFMIADGAINKYSKSHALAFLARTFNLLCEIFKRIFGIAEISADQMEKQDRLYAYLDSLCSGLIEQNPEWKGQIQKVVSTLKEMTRYNPSLRMTDEEAAAAFEKIANQMRVCSIESSLLSSSETLDCEFDPVEEFPDTEKGILQVFSLQDAKSLNSVFEDCL